MTTYTDKPLDFNQQLLLLKSNGLGFADEQKALHTLQHVSYFRIKSYLMPLMDDKVLHIFKAGASFEQALSCTSLIAVCGNLSHRNWKKSRFPYAHKWHIRLLMK